MVLAEVKWDSKGKALGIIITLQTGTPPTIRFEAPTATIVTTDAK